MESIAEASSFKVSSWSSAHTLLVADKNGKELIKLETTDNDNKVDIKTYGDCCVYVEQCASSGLKVEHRMSAEHWYGGPQYYTARWPIEKEAIKQQPYVSNDLLLHPMRFGSILEKYWLSSTGIAIFFTTDDADLSYGVEGNSIILSSDSKLRYTICKGGATLKDTHQYVIKHHFPKPAGLPDLDMFKKPIWSTWARYKIKISHDVVLQFAKEIQEHGFGHSQIEIDDTYTTNYGDMMIDTNRFPKMEAMLQELKKMGFRVTSWIHPFANYDTAAFQEGIQKEFFLKDKNRGVTGLVKWWQGTGAIIDVFNSEAVEWYIAKLNKLKQLGIDSFKFDAGEYIYMPYKMERISTDVTKKYVEVVSQFGGMVETRAAYRNQDRSIYLRMMDKHSRWGFDNGLQTMIPSALHLSMIGYHFILPDMIGGNGMTKDENGEEFTETELPEKELYIRWFQLVTFLQSMQISICPWQYDQETTEIALEMVKLHEEYVAPKIISLAEQTVKDGTPIIRPLWWYAALDKETYTIEDQFMIGDDLMVAPVVLKGVTSRKIYFPTGVWKDMSTGKEIKGKEWLDYPVTIKTVPYFELATP